MSGTRSGVFFEDAGVDTHMTIWRGASVNFNMSWPDEAITGWTAVLQARRKDGTLMLDISSANGGVVVDDVNRLFWFSASPTLSRGVSEVGLWQIKLVPAVGKAFFPWSGTISPKPETAQ